MLVFSNCLRSSERSFCLLVPNSFSETYSWFLYVWAVMGPSAGLGQDQFYAAGSPGRRGGQPQSASSKAGAETGTRGRGLVPENQVCTPGFSHRPDTFAYNSHAGSHLIRPMGSFLGNLWLLLFSIHPCSGPWVCRLLQVEMTYGKNTGKKKNTGEY